MEVWVTVEQEKQGLLKQMLEVRMWDSVQRQKMWKELCKNVTQICLLMLILFFLFSVQGQKMWV